MEKIHTKRCLTDFGIFSMVKAYGKKKGLQMAGKRGFFSFIKSALVALCVVFMSTSAWATEANNYYVVHLDHTGGHNSDSPNPGEWLLEELYAVPKGQNITYGIWYDPDNSTSKNQAWSTNITTTSFQYGPFNLPAKDGYVFNGYWSSASGGTKYIAANGAIQSALDSAAGNATADFTIYAQWIPYYSHTLNNNGGSGASPSTVYTSANGVYSSAANVQSGTTITKLTTNPTRSNYVFTGFYSSTSGGTQYVDANGNFTAAAKSTTSNNTWYAQWSTMHSITFNQNNGTGSNLLSTMYGLYAYDAVCYSAGYSNCTANGNITSEGYNLPARSGYTFKGYYSASSGGTQYIDADGNILMAFVTASSNTSSSFTIYAQWESTSVTCDAGYYLPGGSTSCSLCPAGKYCYNTSKTWTPSSSDQGIRGNISGGSYATCGAKVPAPFINTPAYCASAGSSCSCGRIAAGYYCAGGAKKASPTSSSDSVSGASCGQCPSGYGSDLAANASNKCYKSESTSCSAVQPYPSISLSINFKDASGSTTYPYTTVSGIKYYGYSVQPAEPWKCLPSGVSCSTGYQQTSNSMTTDYLPSSGYPTTSGEGSITSYNSTGLGAGQLYHTYGNYTSYMQSAIASEGSGLSVGATRSTITPASSTGYCWCRLTGVQSGSSYYPATSPWILTSTTTDDMDGCRANCNYVVGNNYNSARDALRSDGSFFTCTATTSYTHTLNNNSGSGVSPSTVYTRYGEGVYSTLAGAQNMTSSLKITSITTKPTRTNYTFKGFYNSTTGSTQYVTSSGSFTSNAKNSTESTWYAQWDSLYTITLDKNGGTGGTSTLYWNRSGVYTNSTGTTTWNGTVSTPTRTGYTFAGYNHGSAYTGIINSSGSEVDGYLTSYIRSSGTLENKTLTAQWTVRSDLSCSAGNYMPAGSVTCTTCPSGSYCPGFTNATYTGSAIGICCIICLISTSNCGVITGCAG